VNGIPIVQARSSGTALGVMDLVVMPDGSHKWHVAVWDTFADKVTPDSSEAALVARYRQTTDALARRPIAVLADSLSRSSKTGQYPLGNLIADAQRAMAKADVAIMNNGGIRTDLPKGQVNYRQLFELQPFGNVLVKARLPGRVIRAALEHAVEGGRANAHISGMVATFDMTRPDGHRITTVLVGGKPLRDDKTYTVAVNDFMSTGGSGFSMFNGYTWQPVGMSDLDALTTWLGRQPSPVRADPGARLRGVKP